MFVNSKNGDFNYVFIGYGFKTGKGFYLCPFISSQKLLSLASATDRSYSFLGFS
jgi:hypothetical protein